MATPLPVSLPAPPLTPLHKRRERFDPAAELSRLRAEAPLAQMGPGRGGPGDGFWLASGYHQVRNVLGDANRFSTLPPARSIEEARRLVQPGNMLQYEPPEHARLRRLLTPEFTVRRMRRLESRIEAIAAGRLDALRGAGPAADLMRHFCWPVAALAICDLLGVPRDDRADLARQANLHRGGGRGDRQMAAGRALSGYMSVLVARQRQDPGEDMIGMLVREHGAELADEELTLIGTFLIASGIDNVSSMLGLGTLLLLEQPDQLEWLRDQEDSGDRAVEELLRYLSVLPVATGRTAMVDVTFGDQLIRAGDHVGCSLLAANRDDTIMDAPDRLDLGREPVSHLAFGHGIHHCLGAPLARMELRIAFLALLRGLPGLRLAVPAPDVRFRPDSSPVYGLEALPVTW